MKKLRRILVSLLLIAALTLPVSAAAFTDADAIRNTEAISILRDLGVVCGYPDGSFLPANNLRRCEAAKLIALMSGPLPEYIPALHFDDLPMEAWSYPYVVICTANGLISCEGESFLPNGFLTCREFAKMLLLCLGYDPIYYSGTDWEQAVDIDAARTGIYSGLYIDKGLYISRDDACMLMYNAMQSYAVSGRSAAGEPLYVLDELMNPVTYLENRFGVIRFSSVLTANQYADLNTDGGCLADGHSKLAGHTEFEIATPYEYLGRTVEVYTVRINLGGNTFYNAVGSPNLSIGEVAFTAASAESFRLALQYSDYRVTDETLYYYNGDTSGSYFPAQLGSDYTITCVDHNGDRAIDRVLVTDYAHGTVQDPETCTVALDGGSVSALWLAAPRTLQTGEAVRCVQLAGRWYIA